MKTSRWRPGWALHLVLTWLGLGSGEVIMCIVFFVPFMACVLEKVVMHGVSCLDNKRNCTKKLVLDICGKVKLKFYSISEKFHLVFVHLVHFGQNSIIFHRGLENSIIFNRGLTGPAMGLDAWLTTRPGNPSRKTKLIATDLCNYVFDQVTWRDFWRQSVLCAGEFLGPHDTP